VSGRRAAQAAALAVVAVCWCVAAWLLWRTEVPGSLHLPHLDPHDYFSQDELDDAASFQRVSRIIWVGGVVVELAVFVAFAQRGLRFVRDSAAGPMGTGMLLGMIGFALLWLAELPFEVLRLWWGRRHDLVHQSYVEAIAGGWLALGGEFVFLCVALAIVMGFARLIGDWWWVPAVPAFAGLALLFAFVAPYLVPTEKLRDPQLRAAVEELAQREHIGSIKVVVQEVGSDTSLPNAEAMGIGPSRRVVLWDTLVGGFSTREVRVVIGHEFGHIARDHTLKLVAWFALFALPLTFLLSRVARIRGGMARPEAVPLFLLALVVLGLVLSPFQNAVVRHFEGEADWLALQATRDPQAAQGLFEQFVPTTLSEPDPPTWDYVMLENHPTIMQRLAMVEAWRRRYATSSAGSSAQVP
jgi:STE24 endopeptidase